MHYLYPMLRLCALALAAASASASLRVDLAPWVAAARGAPVQLPAGGLRLTSAAAAPPPPPYWPPEWRAELTQLNTTSNATGAFTTSFSVGRQASRGDVHVPPPGLYVSLDLYASHLHALLSGPAPGDRCDEAYLPGALPVLDVQNFDFAGEGAFGDEPVWLWTRAPLAYATEKTPQQMPVALLNGDTHIVTAWGPTTVYNNDSWPAGTFDKPAACA